MTQYVGGQNGDFCIQFFMCTQYYSLPVNKQTKKSGGSVYFKLMPNNSAL